MCGIVAIFDSHDPRQPRVDLVARLNDAQWHRGPDEGSVHVEPHIGLGHRRLSIIDVASGQQPMFNEDGSIVVVFNGEIYNFRALRLELQAAGHRFANQSDTEVIVHAWEQWGSACVARFRGMFAFVLWDRGRGTLFAARDRLGVKPLHYAHLRSGAWLFGSELKSLTAHPHLERRLDSAAVEDFLTLGYIPDPRTIWQGVRKLPPAHSLTLRVGQNEPILERYWALDFSHRRSIALPAAADELRARLEESISMRLSSEVPLGAFLSGGVDSSAVVATMARLDSNPVRTFSIGFNVASHDESDYARTVADRYQTEHRSRIVSSDDFGLVDSLVGLYDEPFADSSAIPTYRLCQFARERVTVALSGDGGDETFGGYRRYRLHLAEERIRSALPASLRRIVFGPLGQLYPKLDFMPRPFRARATLQGIAQDTAAAYCNSVSVIRDEVRERLYSRAFLIALGGYRTADLFREIALRAPADDPLSLIQSIDYETYLPGDINTKVDRASMANSLEVREPLMDHELVQWAASLPSALKIDNRGEGKAVLKACMRSDLPHDLLYRPKMGFSVPLARWLRGSLAPAVHAAIESPELGDCGVFDRTALRTLADEHASGRRDHSRALWSVLILGRFLQSQDAPGVPMSAFEKSLTPPTPLAHA